jgi:hypothetical protein
MGSLCFQGFIRRLLISYALLCFVTLSLCNDGAGTTEHLHQNQTASVDPDTAVSERHSRSPLRTKYAKTATKNHDTKTSEQKRSSDDLQSSSSAARSTAKSPLVFRLLQEQETADISNKLAYSPLVQLHQTQEEETVHYQRAPHENSGGVLEYAEPNYVTPIHKETEVRNCYYTLCLHGAGFPLSFCVVFISIDGDRKIIIFPRHVVSSSLAWLGIVSE